MNFVVKDEMRCDRINCKDTYFLNKTKKGAAINSRIVS